MITQRRVADNTSVVTMESVLQKSNLIKQTMNKKKIYIKRFTQKQNFEMYVNFGLIRTMCTHITTASSFLLFLIP